MTSVTSSLGRRRDAAEPGRSANRPIVLVVLASVLDPRAAMEARKSLVKSFAPDPVFWLDCSETQSATRAGVQLLSTLAAEARENGAVLRLIGVRNKILPALRGTPLESLLWQPLSRAAQPA